MKRKKLKALPMCGALALATVISMSAASGIVCASAKTLANDGKFYSDYLTHEETVEAGRKTNVEIAAEGITLLKNENNILPLKGVKRVSVVT